ncbi:MAG: hypothetical protein WBM01_19275, partial [Mycobacterium sp.]
MSGQHSKRNQSGKAKATARRRRRAIGLGSGAGAFLAFGLSPLAAAPPARADVLDTILDPIINSLAGVDPTLGADVSGLATSFDPTFVGDQAAALGSSADSLAAAVPAANPTLADLFQTDFWLPLHAQLVPLATAFQDNPLGAAINQAFATGGFCGLICNGADGTALDPTGGNGGVWFGDGGAGFDASNSAAGTVGGEGGDAGG